VATPDSDLDDGDDQSTRPSLESVQNAVIEVRKRGVGNPKKPLTDLDALVWVAEKVSRESDLTDKIEDVLQRAVHALGGSATAAVLALLGLTPEMRGQKVGLRREAAASAFDYLTYEYFRTVYEKQLTGAVGAELLALVDQKRLEDKEQVHLEKVGTDLERLIARQEGLIAAQERLVEQQRAFIEETERRVTGTEDLKYKTVAMLNAAKRLNTELDYIRKRRGYLQRQ
jgi:hypothetical protein